MDSKLVAENKQSVLEVVIDDPQICKNSTTMGHRARSLYDCFVSTILANFHAGYFRVTLTLCAQVMLWKNLVEFTKDTHTHTLHPMLFMLPSIATTLLWSIALVVLISLSIVYTLRCFHQFDKVKDEFLHHVGVNYLFAPWISCLFLLQTSPFLVVPSGSVNSVYQPTKSSLQALVWWILVVPIIVLDIKLYGQWFTKGKRVLMKVANPASQLSVIANLVAAKGAVYMGWFEIGLCFFSLAMAHYVVLFVTLYQRYPGSNGVSSTLRPVFFLFVATPSMGSLSWRSINGSFDMASKMLFFLSMFLFMSQVSRPTLFRKSIRKFNIAWWSLSFSLTLFALASIEYCEEVKNDVAQTLALLISIISIMVSLALMLFTTLKVNRLFLSTQPNPRPN